MNYQPQWRAEDELRVEWLELCYRLDGRYHYCHPQHQLYTGLIAKYGHPPDPR